MKRLIPIFVVGILLSTAFGAVAQHSDIKSQENNFATHTIFGEYGTATWCGYCKYAHGALKALYKGGWHDFYYVSLVDDKNTHADDRETHQLGLTGFPTVFWDGKYRTNVGASSIPSAMATYNSSIIACGARTVANIDLTISATWLGSLRQCLLRLLLRTIKQVLILDTYVVMSQKLLLQWDGMTQEVIYTHSRF